MPWAWAFWMRVSSGSNGNAAMPVSVRGTAARLHQQSPRRTTCATIAFMFAAFVAATTASIWPASFSPGPNASTQYARNCGFAAVAGADGRASEATMVSATTASASFRNPVPSSCAQWNACATPAQRFRVAISAFGFDARRAAARASRSLARRRYDAPMPEGDTIFRVATILRRALAGRVVTGFEAVAPKTSTAAARLRIVGGTVKAVESNGKHLFITFTTDGEDVVLHTHMKMTGQWHVYRPGERWRAAPSDARVVIRTDAYVAPCFTPPIVELLTARELAIHPLVSKLGPDVIADAFDMDEALRRLRAVPDRDIATALLDQRTLSGIGNVFKCEALFLTRISPYATVAELDDVTLRG